MRLLNHRQIRVETIEEKQALEDFFRNGASYSFNGEKNVYDVTLCLYNFFKNEKLRKKFKKIEELY